MITRLVPVVLALIMHGHARAECVPPVLWATVYSDPAGRDDGAEDLAVNSKDEVVAVGSENNQYIGPPYFWLGNALVRCWDSAGNLAWSRTIGDPTSGLDAPAVAVDSADRVNVIVSRTFGASTIGWAVYQYDWQGNLGWSREYTDVFADGAGPYDVAIGPGDEIVVAGEYPAVGGIPQRWQVRKYDDAGTVVWSRTYIIGFAFGVAVGRDGSIYAGGSYENYPVTEGMAVILKLDPAGNLLWSRTLSAPYGGVYRMAVDPWGNPYAVGHLVVGSTYDWAVWKCDPEGGLIWMRTYNSPANDFDAAVNLAFDRAGDAVVAGWERRPDLGEFYGYLVREYDPNGNLIWSLTNYGNAATARGQADGVAVDSQGRLAVCGYEESGPKGKWLVVKYRMGASLAAQVDVDSATVRAGDTVQVRLTVSNTGAMVATGVSPVLTLGDPALAQATSGPAPSGPVDLAPGGSAVFWWTIKALGAGVLTLTAAANGTDACDGSPLNAKAQAVVTTVGSRSEVAVYPNPFNPSRAVRGEVKFEGVPLGGALRLYTTSGQKVWSTVSSGGSVIEWDGRNSAGSRVAPGVYWWIVESQGTKQRGKLVIE